MKIKNKNIFKKRKSVFIIAEMAWSHDGCFEKAKKIIKGAAEAKADAVSFHITNMENYMVKDYGVMTGKIAKKGFKKISMYDYLNSFNLKDNDWKKLFLYARKLGLLICAMPNDNKSLDLCKKLNTDIYVLAPACFVEEDFIIKIVKTKKPTILRVGGATIPEIKKALNLIKKHRVQNIVLLCGVQSYPTKLENTNLNLIPYFEKIFKLPIGFADHIKADSEMAQIIPLMAIAKGVTVIEKHLTHDRKEGGLDYIAALNPNEFKNLVKLIREAEKAKGISKFLGLSHTELEYRKLVRKRIIAKRNINAGQKITKKNITFKRANDGFYSDKLSSVIDKKARVEIKKDEPILLNKIK